MSRRPLVIIHPETKEELTVEQAAAKVGITPGAMRRRLSDTSWSLRKALTQKGDWNRSKNARSRKPPALVTTVLIPENLINGRSPNAVVKEKLKTIKKLTIKKLTPPQNNSETTKQARIALNEDERDRLHWLMIDAKLPNLTSAIISLLGIQEGRAKAKK
jgi:hypothetical protein